MRILLLTQFYWPEQRTAPSNLAALAESLQSWGHDVTVITGFPNHPFGRVYDGYRLRWRQWDEIRGVRTLRLPLYPDHSLSSVRRAWHYSSFALSAATLGAWLTRRFDPDVLVVYLPPLTNWLPIQVLKLIHRMPIVCWETDLWPDALTATGNKLRPSILHLIQKLDRAVHRQAEKICINSPGLARNLEQKGVPPDRLELIVDWADESVFFPVDPDRDLAARLGMAGRFNVIYGGNFGPAQDLGTLIEAASRLQDLKDFQLVLIGRGESEPELRTMVEEKGLPNVLLIGHQPMTEIHRFYALAEVLLAHLRPDPLFEMQIPSKVVSYLACGRPILCGIAGSAADLVEDAGAGLSCPPGDAAAMAGLLRHFYTMTAKERQRLGESGRRTYLAKYTREVQTHRFAQILSEVVSTDRRV